MIPVRKMPSLSISYALRLLVKQRVQRREKQIMKGKTKKRKQLGEKKHLKDNKNYWQNLQRNKRCFYKKRVVKVSRNRQKRDMRLSRVVKCNQSVRSTERDFLT